MIADTKVYLVDLDGTLAYYDTWHGPAHIGEPIPAMWHRVNTWLNEGIDVRIFTARLAHDQDGQAKAAIEAWCLLHFGRVLPITAEKDFTAEAIWDDRAVQVIPNDGRRVDGLEGDAASAMPVPFLRTLQMALGIQARGWLTDAQLLDAAIALRDERDEWLARFNKTQEVVERTEDRAAQQAIAQQEPHESHRCGCRTVWAARCAEHNRRRDARARQPSSMGSGALRQGLRDMLKVAGLTDDALLEAVQGVQDALRLALRERPIAQKPKKNGAASRASKGRRRAS